MINQEKGSLLKAKKKKNSETYYQSYLDKIPWPSLAKATNFHHKNENTISFLHTYLMDCQDQQRNANLLEMVQCHLMTMLVLAGPPKQQC